MSALLQVGLSCDPVATDEQVYTAVPCEACPMHRFGSLYGELARWVLRLLGWGRAARKAAELEQAQQQALASGQPGSQPLLPPAMLPPQPQQQQQQGQAVMPASAPLAIPAAAPAAGRQTGSGGVGFDAAWVGGAGR